MSEWQRVKFEDLLVGKKISYGVVQPGQFQEVGGVPLIRVNNIKNAKVDVSDIVKIHEDVEAKYAKTRLSGGELLITVVGSVGECAIVTEDLKGFNVARAVSVANIIDGVDKRFVAYQFRTEDLKFQMYGNTNDTVQPTLNLTELKQLTFTLPPLPEQKAIASILSSLDDKIDLLHRQNKTLEAMAETLFRQWFIEEAKEDWEEVPLSEVAVIQNGYAFSSKDYVEKTVNEYEVLKMGHIDKNATLKLNPKRDYVPRKPELKRFVLNYNDIVMPMTDMKDNVVILGVPALVDANDKYVLNQRVARIYLKEDSKLSSIYYLFLQLKDPDFIARLQSTANSGVQVNLSTQAIKDCPIVIPSLEKQAEHRNTITGFYEQISNNRKQIQTLENLRDTLLPKLMSGEVRVQYQTEEVA